MAALKPEVVLTQAPVEISTPFQMLNYSFRRRPTQWNFRRQGAVAADPRFQDGGRKTGSSINRGLSCDIGIVSNARIRVEKVDRRCRWTFPVSADLENST